MAIDIRDLRNAARGARRAFPSPVSPPIPPHNPQQSTEVQGDSDSPSCLGWLFIVGSIILIFSSFSSTSTQDSPPVPVPISSSAPPEPEALLPPSVAPAVNQDFVTQASLDESIRAANRCLRVGDYSCAMHSAREALQWAPQNVRAKAVISEVNSFLNSLESEFDEAIAIGDSAGARNILDRYRVVVVDSDSPKLPTMTESLGALESRKIEEERAKEALANQSPPLREISAKIDYLPGSENYYPAASKRLGEEGVVAVKVCVDSDSRTIGDPIVVDSSGSSRLDKGAVRLARGGRYRSMSPSGEVSCVKFRVRFQME